MYERTLDRTELLRVLNEMILHEDKNEETRHILWDWMCGVGRFMDWLSIGHRGNHRTAPFYIWLRQSGVEMGDIDYVYERCRMLGEPYCKIRVESVDEIWKRFLLTIE